MTAWYRQHYHFQDPHFFCRYCPSLTASGGPAIRSQDPSNLKKHLQKHKITADSTATQCPIIPFVAQAPRQPQLTVAKQRRDFVAQSYVKLFARGLPLSLLTNVDFRTVSRPDHPVPTIEAMKRMLKCAAVHLPLPPVGHISFDEWTHDRQSFACVCLHPLSGGPSSVLAFFVVPRRDGVATAESLAEAIRHRLGGLRPESVTADGANAAQATARLVAGTAPYGRCAAHLVQLVLRRACSSLQSGVLKRMAAVCCILQRPKGAHVLRSTGAPLGVLTPCETRWGTRVAAARRVLSMWKEVGAACALLRIAPLPKADEESLQSIVDVMSPFEELTQLLTGAGSAERWVHTRTTIYLTYHMAYDVEDDEPVELEPEPPVEAWPDEASTDNDDSDDGGEVDGQRGEEPPAEQEALTALVVKHALRAALQHYGLLKAPTDDEIAVLLLSAHRAKGIYLAEHEHTSAREVLRRLLGPPEIVLAEGPAETGVWAKVPKDDVRVEDAYLMGSCPPEAALAWWHQQPETRLTRLAIRLLSRPMTTGAAERTFSRGRWLLPYVRNRLKPDLLEAMVRVGEAVAQNPNIELTLTPGAPEDAVPLAAKRDLPPDVAASAPPPPAQRTGCVADLAPSPAPRTGSVVSSAKRVSTAIILD